MKSQRKFFKYFTYPQHTIHIRILTINHYNSIFEASRAHNSCHSFFCLISPKNQAAQRLNEQTKISQAKDDQEECETRLEKERDIYASNMFDLLAEEENIASYVVNYVRFQQMYFKSALDEIELLMTEMNSLLSEYCALLSGYF